MKAINIEDHKELLLAVIKTWRVLQEYIDAGPAGQAFRFEMLRRDMAANNLAMVRAGCGVSFPLSAESYAELRLCLIFSKNQGFLGRLSKDGRDNLERLRQYGDPNA